MLSNAGNAELENMSREGAVPKRRIKNAAGLIAIADKYVEQDQDASYLRARQLALVNGEAPFDDSELKNKGLTHIVNANFGEANATFEAALAPYTEIIVGVPRIPHVILDSYEGDALDDAEIISEEFDWMIKQWPEFYPNMQLLAREFVGFSVGVAIWPDERTVFWEPVGLKDFKVARDTKVSDESIEVAPVLRTMSVSQLYSYIRNPKAAKLMGWNIDAVKKAIWCASTKKDTWKNWQSHWEEFEREAKENDLHCGESGYHRVQLIYGFNREFSQNATEKPKWTMTIACRDVDDFLYERVGKYNSVNSCFTIFTNGVGQGTFHTLRGLLQRIYNCIQVSNRVLCQAAQGAIASGQIQLQGNAEAIQDFQYIEVGPYSFIPMGLNPVQLLPPTVATQNIPVYSLMSQTMQNNTGSYRSRGTTPDGQARSATEVAQQARQESTLGSASLANFYTPYDKLLTEQYRRAVSPNITANDLGGELALEFRRRCLRRGVTVERMREVVKVQAVRSVGDGSPVMGEMASRQMMELYSLLDEKGKENVLRTVFAKIPGIGYSKVDQFVPKGGPRRVVDFDIANLENANLRQGTMPTITDSQNHAVHIEAHIPLIAEIVEMHRQQQMSDEEAMQVLRPAADHATEHLVLFSNNSFRQQEAAQMRKELQNVTAYVDELEQQVINRMMSEQNKLQGQAQEGQPDPKLEGDLRKLELQLAIAQEKRAANQAISDQKMRQITQQMALADLKGRVNVMEKTASRPGRKPLVE